METLSEFAVTFLNELHNQMEGQDIPQISMHTVGNSLGMEKNECSALAEELMISELVELKTLAGDITITPAGLEVLQSKGLITGVSSTSYELSGELVLTTGDQEIIEEITRIIKEEISVGEFDYQSIEQCVIDLKTLEVQLLSSQPKTAIFLAIMSSLNKCFVKMGRDEVLAPFSTIFEDN